ncbi:hypothetical protein DER45DRAFT_639491 [Fusarium avenaceum]|nr:hypothetical protein DER45DRAFT_639491 [Fusarium avenaceum]
MSTFGFQCVLLGSPIAALLTLLEWQTPSPGATRPELGAVQYYWNTVNAEVTTDRVLTPLQRWRVVECSKELGSALWSLSDVLANPFRTPPSDPIGVTPALQVQELAASRELLTLIYRVQVSSREIHDHDEIEANVALVTPAYTRKSSEAETFSTLLDRLPFAFPLMNRCAAEGKRAPREVVRYAGQGPVGHSQNRLQAISVSSDDPEDVVPKPDPSPPVGRGRARGWSPSLPQAFDDSPSA